MKKKGISILLIIFMLSGTSIIPTVSTEEIHQTDTYTTDFDDLVGYWGFNNGDGSDESGNGYDGMTYGATFPNGISGLGAEFEGTDRIASISRDFDNSINHQMTISVWIYPDEGYVENNCYIFDNREYSQTGGGFILNLNKNNRIAFVLNEAGVNQIIQTEGSIPIQTWTHIVGIFDHLSGEMKLYINGVENNVTETWKPYTQSTQYACIGNNHWADGNWRPFNGIIDELRIYDSALVETEILELYENPGLVNYPPETPTIEGETDGEIGVSYIYTATTTDPEEDDVYYWFDWSDGTNTGWVGPFASGESCSESHIFEAEGSYIVKVKAKDEGGEVSNWKSLEISMPKNKIFNQPLLNILQWLWDSFPFLNFYF